MGTFSRDDWRDAPRDLETRERVREKLCRRRGKAQGERRNHRRRQARLHRAADQISRAAHEDEGLEAARGRKPPVLSLWTPRRWRSSKARWTWNLSKTKFSSCNRS